VINEEPASSGVMNAYVFVKNVPPGWDRELRRKMAADPRLHFVAVCDGEYAGFSVLHVTSLEEAREIVAENFSNPHHVQGAEISTSSKAGPLGLRNVSG
jgi:DNA-binding Lrp family transcriptional regulator